jgi:diguanylate cyclase (GGDEF)-like protein/PAS domain S-box-containing protein
MRGLTRRLLGCLLLALGLAAAQAAPSLPATVHPGTLTVVLDDNYPPYIFRDDQGRLQGILKDRWTLWSQRTGIPVDLQAMDWNQAQRRMQDGRADVIDTLFSTPERLRFYDFSEPYATLEVPIFFRRTISGIVDADSLKGFTVGVKAGDACINTLQEHHITTLRPYPSYETLIKAAANNEVVVFCIDKPPGVYFLYKFGLERLFRYSPPLYYGQFHWAVRRGDDALKSVIAAGFLHIGAEERHAIDRRWLGSALGDENRFLTARHAVQVLLAVALLLGLLAVWNLSLRRRVNARTTELTATLHYLSATLAAIPDLLFEMDIEGVYHDYRAGNLELLAAPPEQLLNHSVYEVMPREAADSVMAALREAAANGTSHGTQLRLPLRGEDYWFELSVARKSVADGAPERFIILSRDITSRKASEAAIEQAAFFDPLTQLMNRRALQEQLRLTLNTCRAEGRHAALLFIDIDNFKLLNDTRGHRVGDALLISIARSMRERLRASDHIARFGGDEFVAVLERLDTDRLRATAAVEAIAEHLLDGIRQPCRLDGIEYLPTASIGIYLFDAHDALHEDEALKRADIAMYRAKSSGRNSICFFDPSMQAQQDARARLDGELRRALAERQFELFYQPQIEQTRGLVGAEALLRWHHPVLGLLPPAHFIALAEETALIVPIGLWVIQSACGLLRRWQDDATWRELCLSVNVSARQFQQPGFVADVKRALEQSAITPGRLKFELTESLVLGNIEESIETMRQLRDLGIRLSLDDFGTGYASLSYLRRLPLDEIKIDRSFMHDVTRDTDSAVIVRTIIDMAHNFGLDVVAEGVEEDAQRDFLYQNGCRLFQGYLVSRPVPLSDFEALCQPPGPPFTDARR